MSGAPNPYFYTVTINDGTPVRVGDFDTEYDTTEHWSQLDAFLKSRTRGTDIRYLIQGPYQYPEQSVTGRWWETPQTPNVLVRSLLKNHDLRDYAPLSPVKPSAESQLNAVYRERAELIAVLSALYESVIVKGADPEAVDWPVIYINAPTGQLSWHLNPSDLELFSHVDVVTAPDGPKWDGHDNAEKSQRLQLLVAYNQ